MDVVVSLFVADIVALPLCMGGERKGGESVKYAEGISFHAAIGGSKATLLIFCWRILRV